LNYNRVLLKSEGRILFVHLNEIDWLESDGNHVELHLRGQSVRIRAQISQLEEKLDAETFVRLNRSVIVNLDFIEEMIPWFRGTYKTVLRDATELILSRNYKERLFAQIGAPLTMRTHSIAK